MLALQTILLHHIWTYFPFFLSIKIGVCQRRIVSRLGQAFITKFESPSQGRGRVFSCFLRLGARLRRWTILLLRYANIIWTNLCIWYDLDGHPKAHTSASLSPWWRKTPSQNYPLTGEQLFRFEVFITIWNSDWT